MPPTKNAPKVIDEPKKRIKRKEATAPQRIADNRHLADNNKPSTSSE